MEAPVIKLKQYILIPKKPKMSPGKIASQACHAAHLALNKQREYCKGYKSPMNDGPITGHGYWDVIDEWEENGMCVIVLQVKDCFKLFNVSEYLKQWDIPSWLYYDEGLTEIDPMTPTALATGVLPLDKHWIFNGLQLFK